MNKFLLAVLVSGLAATAQADSVLPGNAANGQKLVQAHCTRCHGTEAYTRNDRKITDLGGLSKRVRMCSSNVGANFTSDQVTDVVKYLNDQFYHFEK
jgi:cytochrome c553